MSNGMEEEKNKIKPVPPPRAPTVWDGPQQRASKSACSILNLLLPSIYIKYSNKVHDTDTLRPSWDFFQCFGNKRKTERKRKKTFTDRLAPKVNPIPTKVPTYWKFYKVGMGMSQTLGLIKGELYVKTHKGLSGGEGHHESVARSRKTFPKPLSTIQGVPPVLTVTCLPLSILQHPLPSAALDIFKDIHVWFFF